MTRDQVKLWRAWWRLTLASRHSVDLPRWLQRRGMPGFPPDLTPAQARQARRELNAWRASVEGRVGYDRHRPLTRKERRTIARMRRRRGEFMARHGAAQVVAS